MPRFPLLPVAALALALAACDDPNLGTSTAWESEIDAVGAGTVTGTLRAVSRGRYTENRLILRGSTAGAVHPWRIRTGACGAQGTLLGGRGNYPDAVAAANGQVELAATVNGVLESGGSYHVDVLRGTGSDTTLVACGRLDQI